ncbi:hypothetical protein EV426DRAFT_700467 [Tirmania nivea]|nr:hypothetical protein EV426DRAFT_700467 [Tirmania nivea]
MALLCNLRLPAIPPPIVQGAQIGNATSAGSYETAEELRLAANDNPHHQRHGKMDRDRKRGSSGDSGGKAEEYWGKGEYLVSLATVMDAELLEVVRAWQAGKNTVALGDWTTGEPAVRTATVTEKRRRRRRCAGARTKR